MELEMQVSFEYAIKHLSTGAARLYIQKSGILRKFGFLAGLPYSSKHDKHNQKLEIELADHGNKHVMNIGRGELIELRNKQTAETFAGVERVKVTFTKGKLVVSALKSHVAKTKRESRFKEAATGKRPFRSGSLFSGIATLAYRLKLGLKEQGIDSEITLSSDIDPLALSCQVDGNPIWEHASSDALAYGGDIKELAQEDNLPWVDILEIGYPCKGMSTLSPSGRRDLNHPDVGGLFISLCRLIRKLQPSILIFENSVPFLTSETLRLIKSELTDYRWETTRITGHEFGDFEERPRSCVIATSDGLPRLDLNAFQPRGNISWEPISVILEQIQEESPLWKEMHHVKRKLLDPKLNFKHKLYSGEETKIAAIPAGYNSPKIGSPMVAHPNYRNNGKQRLFTYTEHAKIRRLPSKLLAVLAQVADGTYPLVSKRGNVTAVQSMLGNGVSPLPWSQLGAFIGEYIYKHWRPSFTVTTK